MFANNDSGYEITIRNSKTITDYLGSQFMTKTFEMSMVADTVVYRDEKILSKYVGKRRYAPRGFIGKKYEEFQIKQAFSSLKLSSHSQK